jgi:hypothetical protein
VKRFQLRCAHVVVATLVAFTACKKSDALPTDTTKPVAVSSLRAASRGRAPGTMPGELTKPIDDYTGEEFFALVRKLSYSGAHERDRKCRKDPGCTGTKPTRRVLVLVEAVATEDSLAAGTTPPFGVVYARAVNKGDAPEARYGMLPNANNVEYFVIVTKDSVGTMRWRLEQVDTKTHAHTKFDSGSFTGCNHQWTPGARADFKTCATAAAANDSVVKLGLALQQTDDAPIWISCSAGCCTADTP